MRNEIGETIAWLREQFDRAQVWKWVVTRYSMHAGHPFEIMYIGRKVQRESAIALLIANVDGALRSTEKSSSFHRVIVSEIPFPGALRVPALLSSVVPLDRPLEDITSNFHSQLRRELQKNRTRYHLRQVLDNSEIEQVDRDMLRPYASARHGNGASQTELSEVKRMAQTYGRLDLLLCEGEVVGCQLGHVINHKGKRYWSTNRCGYLEGIFSDAKKLRNTNAINIHLAMEWAKENGYDYYDIGVSLARPGDGLLEWKRRRGGELCKMGKTGMFYLRLPKVNVDSFLWVAPIFAFEGDQLTLHLGLPQGLGYEEVVSRYREMAFGGLFKVYLHCEASPSEQVVEMLRSLFVEQNHPPTLEVLLSS
jgi:hypothetical protein